MIKYLIIHHTAYSYSLNPDQFEQTNTYHKQKFNFISSLGFYVAYQYEISMAGTVRQARQDTEEGAHTIGHNKDSIAICLDGNFDVELPTLAQKIALTNLMKRLVLKYGILPENIVPHRKFATYKSCYGSLLSDTWARELVTGKNSMLEQLKDLLQKLLDLLKQKQHA